MASLLTNFSCNREKTVESFFFFFFSSCGRVDRRACGSSLTFSLSLAPVDRVVEEVFGCTSTCSGTDTSPAFSASLQPISMTTDLKSTQPKELAELQDEISSIIETFLHLGVQVHDFQSTNDAKLGLSNHINKAINQLKNLSNKNIDNDHADSIDKILIPSDLINYIQDGRNPDIYTREFVEVVRKINQFLNGKSLAFQNFQNTLANSIKQEFPELSTDVDTILL